MRRRWHIDVEDPEAFEKVRTALSESGIDKEQVTRVELTVEYNGSLSSEQLTLDDVEWSKPEPMDPERKKIGPVQKDMSNVDHFEGERFEGAINPETQKATILRELDGRWLTNRELAEELEISRDVIAAYISQAYYDDAYVRRRSEKPFEHTLSDLGRLALEQGEEEHDDE